MDSVTVSSNENCSLAPSPKQFSSFWFDFLDIWPTDSHHYIWVYNIFRAKLTRIQYDVNNVLFLKPYN